MSTLQAAAADVTASVLARVQRYVEHETPSRAAAEIVALSELVERELTAAGATTRRYDAAGLGRNLLAKVPAQAGDAAPLLVLAHIDTVHPIGTLAVRPFRIDGDRAYGPGAYDMKAGLACVVEALTRLAAAGLRPARPVHVLVTCDEEIGSHSVRERIEAEARAAHAVLVPEPCLPDGGVKTFRKGVVTYRIDARGRAAHAGIEGATAVSAIRALIDAGRAALNLADHGRGTTINIGQIGGGTASNVVAAEAFATVDVRLAEPDEGPRVDSGLRALRASSPEASIRVTLTEDRPPLVRTDAVVRLYEQARTVARELGVDLTEGGSGGGSDGSIAAATGAPTLDGLGPQGAGAHSEDEHVLLSDLTFRVGLMTGLLRSL
jgi:glutamate carboxypeptidase